MLAGWEVELDGEVIRQLEKPLCSEGEVTDVTCTGIPGKGESLVLT